MYFITFIDDYSQYGYIYLSHEKSQALDALKIYFNEIKRQLDRKVKVVISNRDGEYYGRYDETGNIQVHTKVLQKRDIYVQCTMSNTYKMVFRKGTIEY